MEHPPDFSAPAIDRLIHTLSGEATAGERVYVDQWRAAHPAHQALADRLQTVRTTASAGTHHLLPASTTDAWVRAVQERIQRADAALQRAQNNRLEPTPRQQFRSSRIDLLQRRPAARWGVTSLVVGALAIVTMLGWPNRPSPLPATRTYTTRAGESAVVTLRDGARVMLAPRTVLTTQGTEVAVSGEAFFEVAHRSAEPLLVHVGSATVRVLGTSFSVRHYNDDRDVQVAVTEGRVGFSAPALRSAVTVTAGLVAQLHDSTVKTQPIDSRSTYTDWTTHQLVFQQAPVPEVLAALGRWYGYQFRLTDSTLATQHMSAAFDGRSITGTLALLKTTLDVTLTFDDTVVTLQPRHNQARRTRDTRYEVPDSFSTSREVGR